MMTGDDAAADLSVLQFSYGCLQRYPVQRGLLKRHSLHVNSKC
jgi:hypothetical protein